jgi:hypothetical protein
LDAATAPVASRQMKTFDNTPLKNAMGFSSLKVFLLDLVLFAAHA